MHEEMGDALRRLDVLMETFGPTAIAGLLILGILGVTIIGLRGPGMALVLLFLSFSLGYTPVPGLDMVAFFLRVVCLVLLLFNALKGVPALSWESWALGGYISLGLVFTLMSSYPIWTLQKGALAALTFAAITLGVGAYLDSPRAIHRLFHAFVIAGVVWSIVSLVFLREFVQSQNLRFGGGGDKAPTGYSFGGAILTPFMLWAALQRRSLVWRLAGITGLILIPICLFLSATRTAIVMCVLGCAPLVFRTGLRKTVYVWMLLAMVGAGAIFAGSRLVRTRDTRWVVERLTRIDLSGRQDRWAYGLNACLEHPFLGRGIGSENIAARMRGGAGGVFHNTYLSVWHNTGIVGLLLFGSVIVARVIGSFSLMRRTSDPVDKDAVRVVFGVLLALAALSLIENSLASASNMLITTFLVTGMVLDGLRGFLRMERSNLGAFPVPTVDYLLPGAGGRPAPAKTGWQ